jgi:hypothetical protein
VGSGALRSKTPMLSNPNALNYYCAGVPNRELRFAVSRPFLENRLSVGVNAMIASGWSGQTTETFAAAGVFGPGKVGLDPEGLVPSNAVSEVVGVRIPSYASVTITFHFAGHPVQ